MLDSRPRDTATNTTTNKKEKASIRHWAEIDECTMVGSRLKHKEREE
jgi:hypothetical protein